MESQIRIQIRVGIKTMLIPNTGKYCWNAKENVRFCGENFKGWSSAFLPMTFLLYGWMAGETDVVEGGARIRL
jgi:hypothetical protein